MKEAIMAKDTVRRYNVSDAEMLSEARNFTTLVTKHLPAFSGFDSQAFSSESIEVFSTTIKGAEEMPTDNVLIDIMASSTQKANETLEKCYEEVSLTKYYAKKVFRDNKPVMNQFGYNDLTKIRKSVDKMIRFMDDLIGVVKYYESELSAGGYPEGGIGELTRLRDLLKTQRDEQKVLIKERPVKTANRIDKLNEVWQNMVQINDAANILFKDNAELRKAFSLPTHSTSLKNVNNEEIIADDEDIIVAE